MTTVNNHKSTTQQNEYPLKNWHVHFYHAGEKCTCIWTFLWKNNLKISKHRTKQIYMMVITLIVTRFIANLLRNKKM